MKKNLFYTKVAQTGNTWGLVVWIVCRTRVGRSNHDLSITLVPRVTVMLTSFSITVFHEIKIFLKFWQNSISTFKRFFHMSNNLVESCLAHSFHKISPIRLWRRWAFPWSYLISWWHLEVISSVSSSVHILYTAPFFLYEHGWKTTLWGFFFKFHKVFITIFSCFWISMGNGNTLRSLQIVCLCSVAEMLWAYYCPQCCSPEKKVDQEKEMESCQ